jgi:hypothetical protein
MPPVGPVFGTSREAGQRRARGARPRRCPQPATRLAVREPEPRAGGRPDTELVNRLPALVSATLDDSEAMAHCLHLSTAICEGEPREWVPA